MGEQLEEKANDLKSKVTSDEDSENNAEALDKYKDLKDELQKAKEDTKNLENQIEELLKKFPESEIEKENANLLKELEEQKNKNEQLEEKANDLKSKDPSDEDSENNAEALDKYKDLKDELRKAKEDTKNLENQI